MDSSQLRCHVHREVEPGFSFVVVVVVSVEEGMRFCLTGGDSVDKGSRGLVSGRNLSGAMFLITLWTHDTGHRDNGRDRHHP
jgi:hypothetical protein